MHVLWTKSGLNLHDLGSEDQPTVSCNDHFLFRGIEQTTLWVQYQPLIRALSNCVLQWNRRPQRLRFRAHGPGQRKDGTDRRERRVKMSRHTT